MKIIMRTQHTPANDLFDLKVKHYLSSWLGHKRLSYEECEVCYQGETEASFIISLEYAPQFDELMNIAYFLQQESVLVMHDDLTSGRLRCIADGSQQELVKFINVPREQAEVVGNYLLISNTYYVCQ